jgi:hypothetical protein
MIQQKNVFFAAFALMVAATIVSAPNAKADAAPGEGFYLGAFIGHGTGIVQATVNTLAADNNDQTTAATYETDRGGLGLSGIQGGGWAGWGIKTADDLYFGTELSFAGSDEKIELKSSTDLSDGETSSVINSASAQRNWVAGGSVRVGYYVNKDTLFALSGGIAVSQFDVSIGDDDNTYYAGGPQMGASVTTNLSKIDPNLGLRLEFVYTDYLTAESNGFDGSNVNGRGTSGQASSFGPPDFNQEAENGAFERRGKFS